MELDLHQQIKDYCQILISHYSPPLYQLSYQWNLSYEHASTEMKLLPYKLWYFPKLSAENSTESTELDLNQRVKKYCQILISHCSPPLYQLSYQWNLTVVMPLFPYKICYFLKLLLENSTACTHPNLNQRPIDYCQILISRYSPLLYELSYQWNLSDSDSSIEMTLLP